MQIYKEALFKVVCFRLLLCFGPKPFHKHFSRREDLQVFVVAHSHRTSDAEPWPWSVLEKPCRH